jgi:hypothetical protein
LTLLWHAASADNAWSVEFRRAADRPWRKPEVVAAHQVAVGGVEPHTVYRAVLTGLIPGGDFWYQVRKRDKVVFSAVARAPKAADQGYRFVVFGDCGANTPEQRAIAYRTFIEKPDFVTIVGDIVYSRGTVRDYREKFWDAYIAEPASPTTGAPLLRSTLFIGAPGNHDILTRDLEKYPDALAYFFYWDQPLNGPDGEEGSAHVPELIGPETAKKAFRDAAGDAYPRMGNFSFNYANAHWTILDSNPYVDWTNADLRAWVEDDLDAARGSTWRFVAFHHPGFNSSRAHFPEQQMRRLADVFEAGKVDIVFAGHVHNYQRSYPLHFSTGDPADDKPLNDEKGKSLSRGKLLVPGHWRLDKSFDGVTNTRPDGVIYLITGAGGNHLYNPEQQDDSRSWQGFTNKFISKIYSVTVADVDGSKLTIRQVSSDGQELDRFVVTKGSGGR